jgi:RND family efflux transporter MFP subunit
MNATLKVIDTNESTTRAQLKVSQRSRDLARADFDRLTGLSQAGNAVSQAVVENAERTLAQAESQVLQLEQTLELIPSQREEAESERAAADARLTRARNQLDRTRIAAPFSGRIVRSMVEKDGFVSPGTPLLELADDSELELQVAVQASDLRNWILFAENEAHSGWFPPVQQNPVNITWTGSEQGIEWTGILDRVVAFDATTRMATLAVTVSGDRIVAKDGTFPLTDGMFCRVTIPGKTLEQVVALPREAVTFDNQAYLSENGRLRTIDVTVAWATEDTVYVSEGIQPGDLVVGTRLVAPLEGVKLQDIQDDA